MPSVTISRPDLFPSTTVVGIYPPGSKRHGQTPLGIPTAAAIATGTVTADTVTITNAAILQGVDYEAFATVNAENRYLKVRSTLDVADIGRGAGTGTTTSGSPIITGLTASSGAFATGQRIATSTSSAAIPPGTRITAMSSVASGAVTAAAATDVFTKTAHGLRVGDPITFTGLTGGAGITAGAAYYVVTVPDANTFKVATTHGGTPLDVTTDLTAGTLASIAVLNANAGATGAQTLVAEGASPAVPVLGATPRPNVPSSWRAQVRQRRQMLGTAV
jgi:hypothetical protein